MNPANDPPLNAYSQAKLLNEGIPSAPSAISSCLDNVTSQLNKNEKVSALWKDWPKIAGKELSLHCTPLSFLRGVLIIGASHPQWVQALIFNKNQLLAALKAKGHEVKSLKIQNHYKPQSKTKDTQKAIWKKHPSRIDIHGISKCTFCNSPAPSGEISLWGKCGFCRRKDLSTEFKK